MRFTEKKIKTLNDRLNEIEVKRITDYASFKICNTLGNPCIKISATNKGEYSICDYNKITDLIEVLTQIKTIIEEETGIDL